MDPVPVRIKRLSPEAVLPEYHSAHAAGMDLHAAIQDAVTIGVGEIVKIPCGFAMSLPDGYEAQIRPRSGLASKHGLSVANGLLRVSGAQATGAFGVPVAGGLDCDNDGFVDYARSEMLASPFSRANFSTMDRGTARRTPVTPKTHPQRTRDIKMITGENPTSRPRNLGPRMLAKTRFTKR